MICSRTNLVNIYLNDLLFLYCDVCNFVDDTTLCVYSKNLEFVLTKLERHSIMAIEWFKNNYVKMNSDKCHFFVSRETNLNIHGLK